MLLDYLAGRENVADGSRENLNGKLGAIAGQFGVGWLERNGDNPIQQLWHRTDALATIELLNFGDALEAHSKTDAPWVAHQTKLIKSGDQGNRDGAIFEILGLNLFARGGGRVVPAPPGRPGFDGTVVLDDGARILISIKNHRMSSHEQWFLDNAQRLDNAFRRKLKLLNLSEAQLNVVTARYPSKSDWVVLEQDIKAQAERYATGQPLHVEASSRWSLSLSAINDSYRPLSPSHRSSACQILSPHHDNEQAKFIDNIHRGCANLVRQTSGETSDDVCRMILLRLSATASIEACTDWASWFFTETPDTTLALLLLYQTAVVATADGQFYVTHFLKQIPGPRFAAWRQRPDGSKRQLPDLAVLIGVVTQTPPTLALTNDATGIDLSRHYAYQRADIFKTHDPTYSSNRIDIGHPAPGVAIHLVLEGPGMAPMVLEKRGDRDAKLLLLP